MHAWGKAAVLVTGTGRREWPMTGPNAGSIPAPGLTEAYRQALLLIAGRDTPEGLIAREALGITLEQARSGTQP